MMHLLSDRYNALVKVNAVPDPLIIPHQCLPELELPENITFNDVCEENDDCPAVVSVLVLITPEASQWLGSTYSGLEAGLYFVLGLHTVNFALFNSGVYNKSVRFVFQNHNFDFSGEPIVDPDLVLLKNDPFANARRNYYRTDLMILLSDSRYFPLVGAIPLFMAGKQQ